MAEDVEKVSPELIICGAQGAPQTVRYEQINAMLLNEFLKEHKAFVEEQRKVQDEAATIAQLKKTLDTVLARLDEHDAKIQGVSDQVKASQTRQVVLSQQ